MSVHTSGVLIPSTSPSLLGSGGDDLTPGVVALAFSGIPLDGSARSTAEACLAAVRQLVGSARIVLPPSPVPLTLGDPAEGLGLRFRFDVPGGVGELWIPECPLDADTEETLQAQLDRVWSACLARAEKQGEIDGLRFHLGALQQVTHTLSELRELGEVERLALDFIREICMAWWAVLYRSDVEGLYMRRAAVSMRGEEFELTLKPSGVQAALAPGQGRALVVEGDPSLHGHLPQDTAVLAPLNVGGAGGGLVVLGPRMTGTPYSRHEISMVQTLIDATAISMRNAELIEHLRTQAVRDALTGCHNRRGFNETLAAEFNRSRRYRRTLSLIVLDLDHFKLINDQFGHDAGDHVLRRVGRLLLTSFRSTDTPCRPGGEEFAVIFPETPKHEAMRLAERLRASIEELPADTVLPKTFTASLGVAAYPDDALTLDELIREADRSLYTAKAGGRNRVVGANET